MLSIIHKPPLINYFINNYIPFLFTFMNPYYIPVANICILEKSTSYEELSAKQN